MLLPLQSSVKRVGGDEKDMVPETLPVDSCWTGLRSSLLISSHPTQPTSSALFLVRGSFLIQCKLRVQRIQQNGSCKPDGPQLDARKAHLVKRGRSRHC